MHTRKKYLMLVVVVFLTAGCAVAPLEFAIPSDHPANSDAVFPRKQNRSSTLKIVENELLSFEDEKEKAIKHHHEAH